MSGPVFKHRCSDWKCFVLSGELFFHYFPVITTPPFFFNERGGGGGGKRTGSYEVDFRAEVNFWPKILSQEEKHKKQYFHFSSDICMGFCAAVINYSLICL